MTESNQIIILPYLNSNISLADTGKILLTPQTAGATAVVYALPTPAAGLHYTFINSAAAALSGSIQINAGAAIIYGNAVSGPTAGVALLAITGSTQMKFQTAVSVRGDVIELTSDGTNWYVRANSSVGGGITVI